ncbi:MAG: hypothetical protein K0V04_10840, partial [Deltaproteobacteria bacterium]|nr:hypothetical protein [Deltaproteobacteria bacterium]
MRETSSARNRYALSALLPLAWACGTGQPDIPGAPGSGSTASDDPGTTGAVDDTAISEPTTGGSTATGDDTAGSEGTTGGSQVEEPCGEGAWTCLPVPPAGPYGSMTFEVPAAQNWVNTGLFLEAGQQATITESGAWMVSPNLGDSIDHGSCVVGDLVARIGLHYKDPALTCVRGEANFVADKDGILFVGGLADNDLGETYESRFWAEGSKTVSVTSEGATVPTVEA